MLLEEVLKEGEGSRRWWWRRRRWRRRAVALLDGACAPNMHAVSMYTDESYENRVMLNQLHVRDRAQHSILAHSKAAPDI